jgi:hypothetical protein
LIGIGLGQLESKCKSVVSDLRWYLPFLKQALHTELDSLHTFGNGNYFPERLQHPE